MNQDSQTEPKNLQFADILTFFRSKFQTNPDVLNVSSKYIEHIMKTPEFGEFMKQGAQIIQGIQSGRGIGNNTVESIKTKIDTFQKKLLGLQGAFLEYKEAQPSQDKAVAGSVLEDSSNVATTPNQATLAQLENLFDIGNEITHAFKKLVNELGVLGNYKSQDSDTPASNSYLSGSFQQSRQGRGQSSFHNQQRRQLQAYSRSRQLPQQELPQEPPQQLLQEQLQSHKRREDAFHNSQQQQQQQNRMLMLKQINDHQKSSSGRRGSSPAAPAAAVAQPNELQKRLAEQRARIEATTGSEFSAQGMRDPSDPGYIGISRGSQLMRYGPKRLGGSRRKRESRNQSKKSRRIVLLR